MFGLLKYFVLGDGGPIKLVSIGQYRPEKDHPLQLKAMYELRQLVSEQIWDQVITVYRICLLIYVRKTKSKTKLETRDFIYIFDPPRGPAHNLAFTFLIRKCYFNEDIFTFCKCVELFLLDIYRL